MWVASPREAGSPANNKLMNVNVLLNVFTLPVYAGRGKISLYWYFWSDWCNYQCSFHTHHLRSQPPNSLSRSSQYPRDLLQLNIYVLFYDNVLRVEERQNDMISPLFRLLVERKHSIFLFLEMIGNWGSVQSLFSPQTSGGVTWRERQK